MLWTPLTNTALTRNFNGWLDDTVLARGELAADEIQALASSSAAHLGGVKLEQTVRVIASPLSPASLAATASNNTIQLTWSASSGAASYTVKRATSASGPFTTLASDITGASFTARSTGLRYQFERPRFTAWQARATGIERSATSQPTALRRSAGSTAFFRASPSARRSPWPGRRTSA